MGKKQAGGRVRPSTTSMVPARIKGNAFRGAFKKGIEAREKGRSHRANPYDRKAPMPTPQRGLWNAWMEGWAQENTRRQADTPRRVRA